MMNMRTGKNMYSHVNCLKGPKENIVDDQTTLYVTDDHKDNYIGDYADNEKNRKSIY